MDKWPKDKLVSEVSKQNENISYYQTKLRDLVSAYKSLLKEKEALEASLRVLQNVPTYARAGFVREGSEGEIGAGCGEDGRSASSSSPDGERTANDRSFSNELGTLMSSLFTLSVEKCRMEATFQADKKQLRQEKEKSEALIKELQDRLKRNGDETTREIEQLKSRLIVERHEREKESNDHAVMMRELQGLLSHEKDTRLETERTLSELRPKYEMLTGREEAERHRETDLGNRFAMLQKKHMSAADGERRRLQQLDADTKEMELAHELTVSALEARLAELSDTVADYHRHRRRDQDTIRQLTSRLDELGAARASAAARTRVPAPAATAELPPVDREHTQLSIAAVDDASPPRESAAMRAELEAVRARCAEACERREDELVALRARARTLAEQLVVAGARLDETEVACERRLEALRAQHEAAYETQRLNWEATRADHCCRLAQLETQLHRQRDRTLALLDEKDHEVSTLKASFQLFVPGSRSSNAAAAVSTAGKLSQLGSVLDGGDERFPEHESPHILHYAHELARRDVEIAALRKSGAEREDMLRESNRKLLMIQQDATERAVRMQERIDSLERYQSREGANLEYLKNVIVNYVHSKNASSRRHMMNAIAAVLKFTDLEMMKIKHNI